MRFLLIMIISLLAGGPIVSTGAVSQEGAFDLDLRKRAIQGFSVSELPLLDVLLQLGRETDVPLAIEYVDIQAVRDPITLSLKNQTFAQMLDAVLQRGEGYTWSIEDGVVIVGNRKLPLSPSLNLLRFVLPEYRLRRAATIAEASVLLQMELDIQLHGQRGVVGSYAPGDLRQKKIPPLAMTNKTVAQILNTLVGKRQHAAWVVTAPPNKLGHLPQSGLWRILEYSEPMRDYASDLRELPQFRMTAK